MRGGRRCKSDRDLKGREDVLKCMGGKGKVNTWSS